MLDLNENGAPDDNSLGSPSTNVIVRARTQAQIAGEDKKD